MLTPEQVQEMEARLEQANAAFSAAELTKGEQIALQLYIADMHQLLADHQAMREVIDEANAMKILRIEEQDFRGKKESVR